MQQIRLSNPKLLFVFGSNLAGRHGKGAAATAARYFKAQYGIGEGPMNKAYAIPTKDASLRTRTLHDIEGSVQRFIRYARQFSDMTFLVTRIGCGLAGFKNEEIAPMFAHAPSNCILPSAWDEILNRNPKSVFIENDIGMDQESFSFLLQDYSTMAPQYCDGPRIIAWLDDPKRGRANIAFTESHERQIAYRFELLLQDRMKKERQEGAIKAAIENIRSGDVEAALGALEQCVA